MMKSTEIKKENDSIAEHKSPTSLCLHGQIAIVCGASQGIGEASARLLAERGARVILVARQEDRLKSISSELNTKFPAQSGAHQFIALDLSNSDDLNQKLIPLVQNLKPTILINNAGGPAAGPLLEANIDQFDTAFRTHLYPAQILVQVLVPFMKEKSFGRIINIISTSVKAPIANLGVSNTLRSAMANWSKTLANEVGIYGITVNNVLPGYIRTSRFENLREKSSQTSGKSISEVETVWLNQVPLKRIGEPKDMAEAVCFLASPAASYISGINLPVDGGRTSSL